MGLRIFGLKMENEYGEDCDFSNWTPDWHQEVSSADFKLGDDPNLSTRGSRMYKRGRAGVMKPTGTVEGQVDIPRIGHYFRGFLDQYKFTAGSGSGMNTHEFWGGECARLPSFAATQTYDFFQKQIIGAMIDALKLEVSDEFLTFSSDWVYKTESAETIDSENYNRVKMDETDIPLMFYDVKVKLNNKDPDGVQTSFTFEGKNNLNVDETIGLGSRHPQKIALAQQREIDLSLVTTLDEDTMRTILDGEYGEVGAMEPSKCQILKVPLELTVDICEDPDRKMIILFPECLLKVEYDFSDSDTIETTINLSTMGTGEATLKDGSKVVTDMYVRIENKQPAIKPATVTKKSTVTANVTSGTTKVEGATVKLTKYTDSTETYSETTAATGVATISNVPLGKYKVEVSKTGYKKYTGTYTVIDGTNNLDVKLIASATGS